MFKYELGDQFFVAADKGVPAVAPEGQEGVAAEVFFHNSCKDIKAALKLLMRPGLGVGWLREEGFFWSGQLFPILLLV